LLTQNASLLYLKILDNNQKMTKSCAYSINYFLVCLFVCLESFESNLPAWNPVPWKSLGAYPTNRTFSYKTTIQSSKSRVRPITNTLIDLLTMTDPGHSLPTVPKMPFKQRLQRAAFSCGAWLDFFGLEHFSGVPWLSWLWHFWRLRVWYSVACP